MAAAARSRPATGGNYSEIGLAGRKTGFAIQTTGRDDDGMEDMSAFFSPTRPSEPPTPAVPHPQHQRAPSAPLHSTTITTEASASMDMSPGNLSLATMKSQRTAQRQHSLPPRPTPPPQVHISGSPKRASSVALASSPIRGNDEHEVTSSPLKEPARRKLDFSVTMSPPVKRPQPMAGRVNNGSVRASNGSAHARSSRSPGTGRQSLGRGHRQSSLAMIQDEEGEAGREGIDSSTVEIPATQSSPEPQQKVVTAEKKKKRGLASRKSMAPKKVFAFGSGSEDEHEEEEEDHVEEAQENEDTVMNGHVEEEVNDPAARQVLEESWLSSQQQDTTMADTTVADEDTEMVDATEAVEEPEEEEEAEPTPKPVKKPRAVPKAKEKPAPKERPAPGKGAAKKNILKSPELTSVKPPAIARKGGKKVAKAVEPEPGLEEEEEVPEEEPRDPSPPPARKARGGKAKTKTAPEPAEEEEEEEEEEAPATKTARRKQHITPMSSFGQVEEPEEEEREELPAKKRGGKAKAARQKKDVVQDVEEEEEPEAAPSPAKKGRGSKAKASTKAAEDVPEEEPAPTKKGRTSKAKATTKEPSPAPAPKHKTASKGKKIARPPTPELEEEPEEEQTSEPLPEPESDTESAPPKKRTRKTAAASSKKDPSCTIPSSQPTPKPAAAAPSRTSRATSIDRIGTQRIIHEPPPPAPTASPSAPANARRSARSRIAPLQFWKNEKIKYQLERRKSGIAMPVIQEIIRVESDSEDEKKKKKPTKRSTSSRSRAASMEDIRSDSRKRKRGPAPPAFDPEDPGNPEPWESSTSSLSTSSDIGVKIGFVNPHPLIVAAARQAGTSVEQEETELAYSKERIATANAASGSFRFVKTSTRNGFGTGVITMKEKEMKRPKNSGKMFLVFYVVSGRASVKVGEEEFRVGKGGQFMVPTGNMYSIKNEFEVELKLFFAQVAEEQPFGLEEEEEE